MRTVQKPAPPGTSTVRKLALLGTPTVKKLALPALLAAAFGLSGCGGHTSARRPTGKAVFASECAVCHSVIGNESLHRQGGDLLGYRMTREQLVQFTREMPVRHPLTPAQLGAVVDYLLELQRRNAAR